MNDPYLLVRNISSCSGNSHWNDCSVTKIWCSRLKDFNAIRGGRFLYVFFFLFSLFHLGLLQLSSYFSHIKHSYLDWGKGLNWKNISPFGSLLNVLYTREHSVLLKLKIFIFFSYQPWKTLFTYWNKSSWIGPESPETRWN